jgi:hypothetical protein
MCKQVVASTADPSSTEIPAEREISLTSSTTAKFDMNESDLAAIVAAGGGKIIGVGICKTLHESACQAVKDDWKVPGDVTSCFTGELKSAEGVTTTVALVCTVDPELQAGV